MKTTKDYRFWVSLSRQKFDHKPDRNKEVGKLRFERAYQNIDEFASCIAKGYCYAPIFINASFGMVERTDNNFRYSFLVSIDVDHVKISMKDMIGKLQYKPTFSYTSCSNGENGGYSYRLVYCFFDKINGLDEYYSFVYAILESNGLTINDIDEHSREAERYYNGNGCGNIETFITYIIYNKEDFKDYYKQYHRESKNKSIIDNNNTTHTTIINLKDTFINKQFEDDYWKMRMEDVLVKYIDVFHNIEHTPLPDVDDDTPYILFPDDYIEIKRYWKKSNDGRAVKITDGNKRREKLFINGIIRRMINPGITFDNLIYNLLYELVYYISNYNADYVIGKKDIYMIAKNVMKADLSRGEKLKGADRKFMVNPEYCQKYSLNKIQVRNMAYKILHDKRIGELYDCSLTDKENLEVMKEHDLKISLIKLKRWRKENGITKYKKGCDK